MEVTAIGLIVGFVGLVLMIRPAPYMIAFVILCTVFSGSSAINLTALGGASVQPAYFSLAFLALRIFFTPLGSISNVLISVRNVPFLATFCLYSSITALILPRLFADAIYVVPLTPLTSRLYDIYPLAFSAQNITTAFYMLGTLFVALAVSMILQIPTSYSIISKAIFVAASLHVLFGILDIALSAVGATHGLDFIRNGNYAQLNQEISGVRRISGTFPEPSSYARYAFILLVYVTELWIRNIQSKAAGLVAVALFAVLLISTSSTAYVSIAAYAFVLTFRMTLVPSSTVPSKKFAMLAFIGVGISSFLAVAVFNPAIVDFLLEIFQQLTFGKLATESGVQRSLWAQQGFDTFRISYGLGVGAGSFRSSSLLTAIIGSTGIIGVAAFAAHLIAVARQVFRRSEFSREPDDIRKVAAYSALIGLVPDIIGAASCDPGLFFGLFSGIALSRLREGLALDRLIGSPKTPPITG
jgi:hypothetical protein